MARRNRNRYLRGQEIPVSNRSFATTQSIIGAVRKMQQSAEKDPEQVVLLLPTPERGAQKAALEILGLRYRHLSFQEFRQSTQEELDKP